MVTYMSYVKALQTNANQERPDYEYLKRIFTNLFQKHCPNPDTFIYDWVSKNENKWNWVG